MILIALGSNLASAAGTPEQTLRAALAELARGGIRVVAASPFYETVAWPDPAGPAFVNAVAEIETALPPDALLARLHDIERQFGRERLRRNAPRTLDLDLLDYHGRIEAGPPVLPHPRMMQRGFVLFPLQDVAPAWKHPVSGRAVKSLIADLPGSEEKPVRL